MADSLMFELVVVVGLRSSMNGSFSAILGGVLKRRSFSRRRVDSRREMGVVFSSWSRHATALSSRIRLASVTRRLKRGSVARVRKVSLRILVYSGERPRWTRER